MSVSKTLKLLTRPDRRLIAGMNYTVGQPRIGVPGASTDNQLGGFHRLGEHLSILERREVIANLLPAHVLAPQVLPHLSAIVLSEYQLRGQSDPYAVLRQMGRQGVVCIVSTAEQIVEHYTYLGAFRYTVGSDVLDERLARIAEYLRRSGACVAIHHKVILDQRDNQALQLRQMQYAADVTANVVEASIKCGVLPLVEIETSSPADETSAGGCNFWEHSISSFFRELGVREVPLETVGVLVGFAPTGSQLEDAAEATVKVLRDSVSKAGLVGITTGGLNYKRSWRLLRCLVEAAATEPAAMPDCVQFGIALTEPALNQFGRYISRVVAKPKLSKAPDRTTVNLYSQMARFLNGILSQTAHQRVTP